MLLNFINLHGAWSIPTVVGWFKMSCKLAENCLWTSSKCVPSFSRNWPLAVWVGLGFIVISGHVVLWNTTLTNCPFVWEGIDCSIQGKITWSDADSPPFDLIVVHKERHPFKGPDGKDHFTNRKDHCALHLRPQSGRSLTASKMHLKIFALDSSSRLSTLL